MSRLALRAGAWLAVLAVTGLCLATLGRAPAHAAGSGNVLVVMAHPDDEGLGTAGIIANAKAAGRRVYVAIATNGDQGGPDPTSDPFCGASNNARRGAAELGLRRAGETITAMGKLELSWNTSESSTDVFFLGYPDSKLEQMVDASGAITSDGTGLHHTYARATSGGSSDPCNGDLAYLITGGHSELSGADFATDLDRLISLTQPTDIYTHVYWDGHSDHEEVARQVNAAADRSNLALSVHGTLIHPEDTGGCSNDSSYEWPNPSGSPDLQGLNRFTPTAEFTPPLTPPCDDHTPSSPASWGPEGNPDEWVTVPAAMQSTSEGSNLKWDVISSYDSQINCSPISAGTYYFTCGYMRAFVKRREFFWVTNYNGGGPPPDVIPPSKPAKPTGVSLEKAARINLSPLNGEEDLASYTLQRKKSSDSSWSNAKTGITSWPQTNTGLTNGTVYNFRVIAIDDAGNQSAASDPVTVTPADVTAPAKPATPSASALDAAVRVNLSPLNAESDLASYTLQRKLTSQPATSFAAVKTGITTWPQTDASLVNDTSYDYRAIAVDTAGNQSPASNAVSATPLAPASPPANPGTTTPTATPTPTSTPTPTPAPTATPIATPLGPLGPTADLIAPTATFRRPAKRTLASLDGGLTVKVRCSEACTLTAQLDLLVAFTGGKGQRKVNAHLLGRSDTRSLTGAGVLRLKLGVTRSGRDLLAHKQGHVKLTVLAVDAAGNRAQASRTVTITR